MSSIRVVLITGRPPTEITVTNAIETAKDIMLVAQATTGPGALQVCESAQPDVVLLDAEQTSAHTDEIIRALYRHHPQTKILIYAHTSNQLKSLLKAGAHGYILDNTLPDDILAAIRSTHAGKTVVSLDIMRQLLGFPDKNSQEIHS